MDPLDQSPGVEIHRARSEDAAAIRLLYQQLLSDAAVRVLPEQVKALEESAISFLMVACSSGVVSATALLTVCPDVMYQRQPFGVVENLVVAAVHRGSGIGRRLMEHIKEMAREQDCTKLMLLSSSHRHEAHRFFEGLGYDGDRKKGFVKYGSQFRQP